MLLLTLSTRPTQKAPQGGLKESFKIPKGTINMDSGIQRILAFELTAFFRQADHLSADALIQTEKHLLEDTVPWQSTEALSAIVLKTEYQLADMFTKAPPEDRFKYLIRRIGMRCLTPDDLEVLTNDTT
ncbi:hypothetical protein Tco_1327699 [Tanacetum coccineum]